MFLLVLAYPGSPGQKAVKRLCVCVCVHVCVCVCVVSYLSFSLAAISCHHYISKFLDDCISNLFVDFCKLVKIVLKKDDLLTLSLDT